MLSSLTSRQCQRQSWAPPSVPYGWSGEAVRLIEDRLRGLKCVFPVEGFARQAGPRCHRTGSLPATWARQLARHLTGQMESREITMAAFGLNREKLLCPKPESPSKTSAYPSPCPPAPASSRFPEKVGAGITYGCREGECCTCLTKIVPALKIRPPSILEDQVLKDNMARAIIGLACQAQILSGDIVVKPA